MLTILLVVTPPPRKVMINALNKFKQSRSWPTKMCFLIQHVESTNENNNSTLALVDGCPMRLLCGMFRMFSYLSSFCEVKH